MHTKENLRKAFNDGQLSVDSIGIFSETFDEWFLDNVRYLVADLNKDIYDVPNVYYKYIYNKANLKTAFEDGQLSVDEVDEHSFNARLTFDEWFNTKILKL